jgi:peptidoglycan/xylan/chitin deacetylase (PgdA/CDA1 family)
VTFSYDDGMRNDRRLVELLARHGLRGTFNLNSGKLSGDGADDDAWNVRASDVASLYAGHEVAVHGLRHETWNVTLPAVAAGDIARDRLALEALAGHPVEGSAYPCGEHSKGPAADAALRALGIVHARICAARSDFAVPEDFLAWGPTIHQNRPDAAEVARKFLDAADPATAEPALFYCWGHSFEFRTEEDWAAMDALCALFGGRDDVWAATNAEICRYVLAFRALHGTLDGRVLENPTAVPLWLVAGGKPVVLQPGGTLRL